jgi:glycyl-tRNA synthetase
VRITRDLDQRFPIDPPIFTEDEERALYTALRQAEEQPRRPGSIDDFLTVFLPLIPTINRFFDTVLVMADDLRLRQNRLGLLQRIADLASGVADMTQLEGF